MTSSRLQAIEEIFHSALAERADCRAAFLDRACEADRCLRGEVETLLEAHERATDFVETPAIGLAAEALARTAPDLLIGRRIAHYELLQRIGSGGMSDVYLAADVVAGRQAALKLLPLFFTADEERRRRFEQESRAVVALNHPNIVTVYEVGADESLPYIASELIHGKTVRQLLSDGPLELERALDIAIQAGQALAAAHEAGIVHRDIKPENIMLRPDGYVKVLDFGIAKLARAETAINPYNPPPESLLQTHLGSVVGTARYMSPEQACGEPVSSATDIWSLAAVLHEMITGSAPFAGDTASEVIRAILTEEPAALRDVTGAEEPRLSTIVRHSLQKDPAQRFASVRELVEELIRYRRRLDRAAEPPPVHSYWNRIRGSPIAAALTLLVLVLGLGLAAVLYHDVITRPIPEKSIAVLPFTNLTADKAGSSFSAGIQDEILSDLAKISDLKVISRTSSSAFPSGKARNWHQIGRELGVANLLEGSVQQIGERIRIHAQLIDARTDSHLWAQTFDRDVSDIFAVQSEIATTIASQLRCEISGREKASINRPASQDPMAADLYQRAFALEQDQDFTSQPNLTKRIDLLRQALARDSSFTLAYCALARAHSSFYTQGYDRTGARLALTRAALENARRIDPASGDVHLAWASYLALVLRDYDRARAELELARRTLPNDPAVYAQTGYIDRRQGRWSEAIINLDRAVELDPRNFHWLVNTAFTYAPMHRYAEAEALFQRALEISPGDVAARIGYALDSFDERADLGRLNREFEALTENRYDLLFWVDELFNYSLCRRDPATAERALALIPADGVPGMELRVPKAFYEAELAAAFHRPETAIAAAESARAILERLTRRQPDNALAWSTLGNTYALLGSKEDAVKAARHACELLPVTREPTAGTRPLRCLAGTYAMLGENDLALKQLAAIVQRPMGFSYGELKLHPVWDPLRGDPRFEQLVASLAPKR